jgi:hypothetical protein
MRARLYAMGDVTPEFFAYTEHFSLDLKTIEAHAGLFAVVLASFRESANEGPVFEFDVGGVPAAVIEALAFDQQREPFVADLVAWPLHDPWSFATALGQTKGADVLGIPNMVQRGGNPLEVYSTPLDWLRAGCAGCVPLNDAGGRYWLDKAGGPFVVRNVDEGLWLQAFLGSRASRHHILVPLEERAA